MKTGKNSFAQESYRLSSCELHRLEERDVDRLSQAVASMDPWHTLGYSSDALSRYLLGSDSGLYRYAAMLGDEWVAVACVRYPWLRGPFLELLAVFTPYQGKGLGRELILWMENEVRSVSTNLWTTVSSFNARGLAFYRALGFLETAVLPNLVSSGFDEILMRKTF